MTLSPARLAEIRARVEKATTGRWVHGVVIRCMDSPGMELCDDPSSPFVAHEDSPSNIATCWPHDVGFRLTAAEAAFNASFIAHARQDVPDLLDEVAALQARLAELCCKTHPCPKCKEECGG